VSGDEGEPVSMNQTDCFLPNHVLPINDEKDPVSTAQIDHFYRNTYSLQVTVREPVSINRTDYILLGHVRAVSNDENEPVSTNRTYDFRRARTPYKRR
jgi:hypothetical protein